MVMKKLLRNMRKLVSRMLVMGLIFSGFSGELEVRRV